MSDSNIINVLYVDDDEDDKNIFIECLKEAAPGITCHTADDGSHALQVIEQIPIPVCIYIDINMPIMNGIDLLKTLRAHKEYKKIPTFIISTTISGENARLIKELGAVDYIRKPSSYESMVQILKDCLPAHSQSANR